MVTAGLRPVIQRPLGRATARMSATSFTAARRTTLDDIATGFETMKARFRPSKAKGLLIRMQFVLTGRGGGSWFVEVKDGTCTVTKGRGKDPGTTLEASAADYLKVSNGEMNKVMALLRGKLRVKGDIGSVRPFFACFDKQRG